MPDVRLAPEKLTTAGLSETFTGSLSISDTYLVNNNGRVFLHFKKTGASDCVVTVITPNTVSGLAIADLTVTVVATTGDKLIGPFPPSLYNTLQDLKFTLSNIAGLSVAIIRM